MKKTVLVSIIIIILGLSVIGYNDYRTFAIRKGLYSESVRIQERIAKYEKILNETDKIRVKVEIIKRKEIDDKELKEIIKKFKNFLAETENVKTKYLKLIYEYNKIAKQYNSLPSQKLLFEKNLPEAMNSKTQHKPLADR